MCSWTAASSCQPAPSRTMARSLASLHPVGSSTARVRDGAAGGRRPHCLRRLRQAQAQQAWRAGARPPGAGGGCVGLDWQPLLHVCTPSACPQPASCAPAGTFLHVWRSPLTNTRASLVLRGHNFPGLAAHADTPPRPRIDVHACAATPGSRLPRRVLQPTATHSFLFLPPGRVHPPGHLLHPWPLCHPG